MLANILKKIKFHQYTLFLGLCLVLISVISYNIGRINALERTVVKITKEGTNQADIYKAANANTETTSSSKIQQATPKPTDFRVIASKKSASKRYHYLWCIGGKQIKEGNKIWFNSAAEAETAGYTLAGNCEL